MTYGVLQGIGSIFHALQYLQAAITGSELQWHWYADDIQLHLALPSEPKMVTLNWCLEEVMGWTRLNNLKLNPDKMEVLRFGAWTLL